MKQIVLFTLLVIGLATALNILIKKENYSTLNLENIKEFGMGTHGGENGRVVFVTNLKAKGFGSLKWALEQHGKRTIKFKVGGIIDLSNTNIRIKNPHVSVLGASAPYPGITIVRGGLIINTSDVIINHIRIRPGDSTDKLTRKWEPDGITISYGNAKNIFIDHVSTSWAVDENIAASGIREKGFDGAASNITISNSIIAEGLNNSIHSNGEHSKGILVHDFVQNVAIIGNLFVSNAKRNPYFKGNTTGVIVNNIIYNVGEAAIQLNYVEEEYGELEYLPTKPRVSIVGNILVYGDDTSEEMPLINGRGQVYIEDNMIFKPNGETSENYYDKTIETINYKDIWPYGLTPIKALSLENTLLKNVGARPWQRDDTDKRIIENYINRNSKIINSQEDVGGYPHN